MITSAKEIDETKYWLELIELAYEDIDINEIYDKLDEQAKITNSIIATSKRNNSK